MRLPGAPLNRRVACVAWALASCLSTLACEDLPAIAANECGNSVVESPEACDGYAPKGTRCLPPGDEHQCRYGCAEFQDPVTGTLKKPACPEKMSCGTDGVCRIGSGSFEQWGDFVPGPAFSLQLGDLDGDGRDELLALGNSAERWDSHPRVFFFDEQGRAQSALDPLTPLNSPTIAPSSTEDQDFFPRQIVGGTQFGLTALFANPAHEIASIPYPYQINTPDEAYGLIRLKGVAAEPSEEEFLLHFLGNGVIKTASGDHRLAELGVNLLGVIGEIVPADIIENDSASSCDELVFTVQGDQHVYAVSICDADDNLRFASEGPKPIAVFPGDHFPSTKPILAKVNDDNHLDLVVGDNRGNAFLAYGRGDGTFSADERLPSGTAGPLWPVLAYDPEDPAATMEVPCPLAIGELVRPGQHDWVLPSAIYIVKQPLPDYSQQSLKGIPYASNFPSSGEWDLAVIADITGDGRMDLVASSASTSNLDVFAGTGRPLLNGLAIPTRGPVQQLATGDYNGDQITDIAMMQEQNDPSAPAGSTYSLAIAFSERDNGPTESVEVAEFDSFSQLISGNYETNDMIEEIGVLSQSQPALPQQLTLFMGNRSKRPIASFGLWRTRDDGERIRAVPIATATIAGATPGVLIVAVDDCLGEQCFIGLWYTHGTGSKRLDTPQFLGPIPTERPNTERTNVYDLTSRLDARFVIGSTNLDDGAREAQAFLFTSSAELNTVSLWQLVLPTTALPELAASPLSLLDSSPGQLQSASPPKLMDLDGDHWQDLVVSFVDPEAKEPRVLVLWSEFGNFSFSRMTTIPTNTDTINDLAVVNVAETQRLYAATNTGVFEIRANKQRTIETLTPVLVGKIQTATVGGQALALGDMTGDGLPDLALAVPGGLRLYAQVERVP